MGEGTKYSTVGGLIGLLLSESAVNLSHFVHGGDINQPLRVYFDLLGYATFSALGSGISGSLEEARIARHEGERLTTADYMTMLGNAVVPAVISISGLIKHDGEMPFIH